jgi:hypothetical protein
MHVLRLWEVIEAIHFIHNNDDKIWPAFFVETLPHAKIFLTFYPQVN